jgi:hypothetical protein
MDERVRSRGSVRVLDEGGEREGFCSLSHAERLVGDGVASFTSATRRCVRRKPPNPAQSGEERKGRLRIRQSGRYGPMVVQVESGAEEVKV